MRGSRAANLSMQFLRVDLAGVMSRKGIGTSVALCLSSGPAAHHDTYAIHRSHPVGVPSVVFLVEVNQR